MLKQRSMQQIGGSAITHGAGGTTNPDNDRERRDKDKQPSETELK